MSIITKIFFINIILLCLIFSFIDKALDDIALENPRKADSKKFKMARKLVNAHSSLSVISVPLWLIYIVAVW